MSKTVMRRITKKDEKKNVQLRLAVYMRFIDSKNEKSCSQA